MASGCLDSKALEHPHESVAPIASISFLLGPLPNGPPGSPVIYCSWPTGLLSGQLPTVSVLYPFAGVFSG